MSQTITVQFKLIPSKEQASILSKMSQTYISTINTLVSEMVETKRLVKKSSKDVDVYLPSAVKNQAINDAKSVFKRAKRAKFKTVPTLKKPVCTWNNQNYSFDFTHISIPIMIDGKTKKIPIRALLTDKHNRNVDLLKHKLGALRITKKSNKWIAQIAVTISTNEKTGKKKKVNAIRNSKDKEQRWMKDQDHKVSRAIMDFAKENNVSVIRLEKLANIRQTARTSRKNEKNLHTWSFYRLAQFIEYKANVEGIKVEYVNPAYTSQTCPKCFKKNKAQDRNYICQCGFQKHRDLVGAMNIRYAPVIDGHSRSA